MSSNKIIDNDKKEKLFERFKAWSEILFGLGSIIIGIMTFVVYCQMKDIDEYNIQPQFVVKLYQNEDFGMSDKMTKSVEDGEIPFQTLTIDNMGHFNNAIKIDNPITVLFVDRYENGEDKNGTQIPVKVENFFNPSSYLISPSRDTEIYRNNIYLNYMRDITNSIHQIYMSLNTDEVKKFRDGKTVQLYPYFAHYVKVTYELNSKAVEEYYIVNYTGSEKIIKADYEKIEEASDTIDILGETTLYDQLYNIVKPKS